MGKTLLPPGFRFHPTDVELVLYYLKRKIMGKKFHFDAILELNIYKFSPWDLPDKSCLKSKDLEWYFFVPRERKYTCGARMNRAAERGFWKTTGRDRPVIHYEQTIGMVKTLVFHEGHPPKGKRTDWVIHEYRIVDNLHTKEGTLEDSYVLCKVFQKSGPGPRNGAQYGAPFKEEDWENDVKFCGLPIPSDMLTPLPEPINQACSVVTGVVDPGCTSGQPFSEPSPSLSSLVTDEVPTKNKTSSVLMSVFPGSTPIQSLVEPNLSLTRPYSTVLPPDADDLSYLFASFPENTDLPPEQNIENPGLDVEMMPRVDETDIFSELCNLDSFADLNGGRSNFYGSPPAFVSPQEDASFFELDDLAVPVHHTTQVAEAQPLVGETFYSQNSSFPGVQPFNDGGIVPGNQFISTQSQLQWLLEQHIQQVVSSTQTL